jgi:hypothetical protein
MTTTAAPVREDLKVGGHYTARANADGTYDIMDVCIFAEIPAGAKRNSEPIGRDWQEAALMQSRAREAGGHLAPVHIYHSDEVSTKPIYAGKMRLRAVRQMTYEGQTLWATFADILGMPAEVFEKVRRGFLPYRSVEIHNWAKPEIDSLALMDTDVPFFRMPMLNVGTVIKKDAEIFMDKRRPSVACRLDKKQGGFVLFRFAERGPMAKEEDDDEKKPKSGAPEAETGGADPALNAPPKAEETEDGADEDVDDESTAGAEMEDEGGAVPTAAGQNQKSDMGAAISQALAPVTSMLQSLGSLVKQLNDRLGPQPQPQEKLEAVSGMDLGAEATGADFKDTKKENVMADVKDPKASEKVTFSSKEELKAFMGDVVKEAVLSATGELKAEVASLKAKTSESEKRAAAQARFEAAKQELEANGQHVNEDLAKHLFESAEVSEELLKKQLAIFKSTLPKEPPKSADEFETGLAREADVASGDDEVNAFCAEYGPRHAGWAKAEMAKFRAFQKAGGSDTTAEEWLQINFRSATMAERNKV